MNSLRPPTNPAPAPPPGDLEEQLRAFFRHERPNPWPAFEPPAGASPRRSSLFRSRFALAASLAILFLSQWILGGIPSSGFFGRNASEPGALEATQRHGSSAIRDEAFPPRKIKPRGDLSPSRVGDAPRR